MGRAAVSVLARAAILSAELAQFSFLALTIAAGWAVTAILGAVLAILSLVRFADPVVARALFRYAFTLFVAHLSQPADSALSTASVWPAVLTLTVRLADALVVEVAGKALFADSAIPAASVVPALLIHTVGDAFARAVEEQRLARAGLGLEEAVAPRFPTLAGGLHAPENLLQVQLKPDDRLIEATLDTGDVVLVAGQLHHAVQQFSAILERPRLAATILASGAQQARFGHVPTGTILHALGHGIALTHE